MDYQKILVTNFTQGYIGYDNDANVIVVAFKAKESPEFNSYSFLVKL